MVEGSTSSGAAGGAGGAGQDNRPSDNAGHGGLGVRIAAGNPSNPSPIGYPGPGSGADATGWIAGGGGGEETLETTKHEEELVHQGAAPYAGAGQGPSADSPNEMDLKVIQSGGSGSGSGGGGGWTGSPVGGRFGGNGGGGLVVVRYKIAETQTQDAKATGGSISFYGGKTIHTFTGSGTFTVTSGPVTAEMVIVAGGASGGSAQGSWSGGGGGAGGMVIHPGISIANGPYAVTIGAGGGHKS